VSGNVHAEEGGGGGERCGGFDSPFGGGSGGDEIGIDGDSDLFRCALMQAAHNARTTIADMARLEANTSAMRPTTAATESSTTLDLNTPRPLGPRCMFRQAPADGTVPKRWGFPAVNLQPTLILRGPPTR